MNFMNEDWCILMKYVAQREYITRKSSVILCYPSSISHLPLFAYVIYMRKETNERKRRRNRRKNNKIKIKARKARDKRELVHSSHFHVCCCVFLSSHGILSSFIISFTSPSHILSLLCASKNVKRFF